MSVMIYKNGAWTDIDAPYQYINNAWQTKDAIMAYENGAWVEKWSSGYLFSSTSYALRNSNCKITYSPQSGKDGIEFNGYTDSGYYNYATLYVTGEFVNPTLSAYMWAYSSYSTSNSLARANFIGVKKSDGLTNQSSYEYVTSNVGKTISATLTGTFKELRFYVSWYTLGDRAARAVQGKFNQFTIDGKNVKFKPEDRP